MKRKLQSTGFLYRETVSKLTCAFTAALLLLCLTSNTAFAQKVKKLGKVKDFHSKVTFTVSDEPVNGLKKGKKNQVFQTSESDINATINVNKFENGTESAIGEIPGSKGSAVYFNFRDGKVNGRVIIPGQKKSYKYSTDENGEVVVAAEDINTVVCVDYHEAPVSSSVVSAAPASGSSVYNLQSLPGAEAVVKLDFDGEVVTSTAWNGGNTINAAPYDVTEADVMEIWRMISEDFKAFNLNITTSESVYQSAPLTKRMKCIFTPTNFYPNAGGVAYIGSFTWGNNTPCWVFNGGVKAGGESGSHEIGHTVGLDHDGRTSPSEDYFYGTATWAPIMGVGFSSEPVTWSKGEYTSANNLQDDVAIIAGATNGFGYKTDDVGNTITTSKPLFVRPGGIVLATENEGIVTTAADLDVFSFTTSGGTASFTVNGAQSYQNLNVEISIRNSSNTVLLTSSPTNTMNATISLNLAAGTYYLVIDGVGNGNVADGSGYSDYSSIGEYTISGTIQNGGNVAPITTVTSPVANAQFNSPANFSITATATDQDGSVVKVEFLVDGVKIGEDLTSPYTFAATAVPAGTHVLTTRAFDNLGLSAVSAPVSVIVNSTAPLVSITAPVANTIYLSGSFTITANASDPGGAVKKVEFYLNNTLVGSATTAPYSLAVVNAPNGFLDITAKAFDFDGQITVSAPVTVVVDGTAPTVSLTAPANNSQFTAPATFELISGPNDLEGPIKKVEFFQNGVKIGEDLFYPTFGWPISNLAAGTYTFTAKAYDQVGRVGTSAPLTIVVNAVSCSLSEATPLSANYVVRNSWNDQSSGSAVINESGALKVTQRAWGQNELYVIETGKSFNITNGQVYNVKFDFKDFQAIPVAGVDIGFATGLNLQNSGPVLVQSLAAAPAGFSSANFTTKSLNITSAYTGSVNLVFRLRWNAQPNAQIADYIKNITVCSGAGTPARFADADVTDFNAVQNGVVFMPNPTAESFKATTAKAVDLLTVTDMKGTQVYQINDAVAGEQLQFGDDLTAGVYFVSVNYADGTRETLRLIRTK